MKIVYENSVCSIIDNVLTDKDFELLWLYLETLEFTNTQLGSDRRWALTEEPVYRSKDKWFHNVSNEQTGTIENSSHHYYPTDTPVDKVLLAVEHIGEKFVDLIGNRNDDWTGYGCRMQTTSIRNSLMWHVDRMSANFIYFCHPQWKPDWDGSLMVACAESRKEYLSYLKTLEPRDPLDISHRLTDWIHHVPDSFILDPGIGTYIIPKPNRLVFLKKDTIHSLNQVHESARYNVRTSLTGAFYLNPSRYAKHSWDIKK